MSRRSSQSQDCNSAIVAHSKSLSRINELSVSIQQISRQQAVPIVQGGSRSQNKRLSELLSSFHQSLNTDQFDQSSLGLVPADILNLSSDFVNGTRNIISEKNNGDQPKTAVINTSENLDDESTVYCRRQAGDGKEETNDTNKSNIVSSIDSEIEFSAEQISARSSTVDSYKNSMADGTSSAASNLLSKLFLRHSLDMSVVEASNFTDFFQSDKSSKNKQQSEQSLIPEKSELLDTKFLRDCHESEISSVSVGNESDASSFISGDAALEMLKNDEEIFNKDNELLITENIADVTLGQSWLSSANYHDITRPSWCDNYSSDDKRNSRISIGEFMRAKTETLDVLGEFHVSKAIEFEPLRITSSEREEEECSEASSSLISTSAISMVMGDTSLRVDSKALAVKLMTMAKSGQPKITNTEKVESVPRAEASGASFSEDSDQQEKQTPIDTMSNAKHRDNGKDWKDLKACRMADKDVQVTTIESPNSHVMLSNVAQYFPHPYLSSCNSSINNAILPSSTPIALHLLRSDSIGRRPSLDLPTKLVFSECCCVGASVVSQLPVQNPTSHWLEGSMKLLSLTCDGCEQVNTDALSTMFTFEKIWTVEPNMTKNLKVKFTPSSVGQWVGQMKISWRLKGSGDSEWSVSTVIVDATAENARIEIHPCDLVDFGAISEECLSSKSVLITNTCHAPIPIRILIECVPGVEQNFYFPHSVKSSEQTCSYIMQSVINCQGIKHEKVIVSLKAPSIKKDDDDILVLRTNLRVELDVPDSTILLGSVLLKALVGAVRLYTRQDVEPIPLNPFHDLPLHNRGKIPLDVQLLTNHPNVMTVSPSYVSLQPEEQTLVRLTYQPENVFAPELISVLVIKIQPEGPVFEMYVKGMMSSTVPRDNSRSCLHSDHHLVNWGVVPLHERTEKTVKLYNASSTETLHLCLSIVDDSGCSNSSFHLVMPSGVDGIKCVQTLNLSLMPLQRLPVMLFCLPTSVKALAATLVIKPALAFHCNNKVKFSIPLGGYGGAANVQWAGVTLPPANMKQCDWVIENRTSNGDVVFMAKNCGHRSAFVKILACKEPSSILQSLELVSAVSISPSQFILREGAVQHVTLKCDSFSARMTFYVCLVMGDEVLRDRFRRLDLRNVSSDEQLKLRTLLLADKFLGEIIDDSRSFDHHLPLSKADIRNLVYNMKTKWIAVLPSVYVPSSDESSFIFRPLVPEETFSETVNFFHQSTALSPPTREHTPEIPIRLNTNSLSFQTTPCGSSCQMKLTIRNPSWNNEVVNIKAPAPPFFVDHSCVSVKPRYYVSLPIHFRPCQPGYFISPIYFHLSNGHVLSVQIIGESK